MLGPSAVPTPPPSAGAAELRFERTPVVGKPARPAVDTIAGQARARHIRKQQSEQLLRAAPPGAPVTASFHAGPAATELLLSLPTVHFTTTTPIVSGGAHNRLKQRAQAERDSADQDDLEHRLTLGPLTTAVGFDDVLARIDKLHFSEFSNGDPAAGTRFAEHVFEGLHWDAERPTPVDKDLPQRPQSPFQKEILRNTPNRPLTPLDERPLARRPSPLSSPSPSPPRSPPRESATDRGRRFGKRMLVIARKKSSLFSSRQTSPIRTESPPLNKAYSMPESRPFSITDPPSPFSTSAPTLILPPTVEEEEEETGDSSERSAYEPYSRLGQYSPARTLASSSPSPPSSPSRSVRARVRELFGTPFSPQPHPPPPQPRSRSRTNRQDSWTDSSNPKSLSPRVRSRSRTDEPSAGDGQQLHKSFAKFRSASRSDLRGANNSAAPSHSGSSASSLTHRNMSVNGVASPRKSLDAASRKSSDLFFEFVDELYSRADPHGFVVYPGTKPRTAKAAEARFLARDRERSTKWRAMARDAPTHPAVMEAERRVAGGITHCGAVVPPKVAISPVFTFVRGGKFVSRLHKGVPQLWRGHVWYHLITSLSGVYDRMTSDQVGLAEADFIIKYHQYKDEPSGHDEDIMLVVPKTFANHIWFMQRQGPGQLALARLLTAYANYDGSLSAAAAGGLNNLAAMLLTVMEEERAFIALIHLLHAPQLGTPFYNVRVLVSPPPLVPVKSTRAHSHGRQKPLPARPAAMDAEVCSVHDALMSAHVPRLVQRFRDCKVSTTAYAPRWYATFFLSLCNMDAPPRRYRKVSSGSNAFLSDCDDSNDDRSERGPTSGNTDDDDEYDNDAYQRRAAMEAALHPAGKRWEGVLGFPTAVRCWDFIAAVGWEGACVIAVCLLKHHEATLLSLPSDTLLPFLCNGVEDTADLSDHDSGTSMSGLAMPPHALDRIRDAITAVPSPDPDRFMRLVRRTWDAR